MVKYKLRVTLTYTSKTRTIREVIHHAPKKQTTHSVLQELETVYSNQSHVESVEIEIQSITEIKEGK